MNEPDEEAGLTTVARLLKERTAATHECVEARLDLADHALDPARLRDVLTSLHAFWAGTEPVIDSWAAQHLDESASLRWSRRRRAHRLARDVEVLGGSTEVAAPPFVEVADTAAVLGWLYVAEGSTLGGAVITRALRRRHPDLHLEFFAPYDEGPGPMWKQFQDRLESWAGGDELRTERVVNAGVAAFGALEAWTAPLAREAVA
ncbi:biliverdin-producing heme oxygenase [uncultured Jatrophihabitans sp.]|uniref:biliverdin-producing heme oxygenase n=1 Tax=uncultured Jatrophihabitans sp. TaxID=1610747 RepID=UPI0035C9EF2D